MQKTMRCNFHCSEFLCEIGPNSPYIWLDILPSIILFFSFTTCLPSYTFTWILFSVIFLSQGNSPYSNDCLISLCVFISPTNDSIYVSYDFIFYVLGVLQLDAVLPPCQALYLCVLCQVLSTILVVKLFNPNINASFQMELLILWKASWPIPKLQADTFLP